MGQNLAKSEDKPLQTNHPGMPEVTRESITRMLFETHLKCANAQEEVMCIREIGKINGLYESKKPEINVNIIQSAQKLEVMSDEELLKLTGGNQNLLSLSPSEYNEIEDAQLIEGSVSG